MVAKVGPTGQLLKMYLGSDRISNPSKLLVEGVLKIGIVSIFFNHKWQWYFEYYIIVNYLVRWVFGNHGLSWIDNI